MSYFCMTPSIKMRLILLFTARADKRPDYTLSNITGTTKKPTYLKPIRFKDHSLERR